MAGFAPKIGTGLMVHDVTGTFPQVDTLREPPVLVDGPISLCAEEAIWSRNIGELTEGDPEFMLVVSSGDLDPRSVESFEFTFDRSLHESMRDAEPSTIAQLSDLGPIEDCENSTADLDIPLRIEITNHNSRLVVRPLTTLPAGHRFRLRLVPPGIVTYPKVGESGPISYFGSAPKIFHFATRPIPGRTIAEGAAEDVVDMLKFGHILIGGTLDGKLIAMDVSKPTAGSGNGAFETIATYEGNADQIRALATDGHNRLFFGARFGGSWGVKTVRVEDVRDADSGSFGPIEGGITFGYALGTNSGVSASEYLALSTLPSGTPVDLEVMVQDEIGDSLELVDFYKEYTGKDLL